MVYDVLPVHYHLRACEQWQHKTKIMNTDSSNRNNLICIDYLKRTVSALIHPMARGLSKEPVMMNYPSWKGEGGDIPSLDVACQSVWKMGAVSWVQGLARPRGAVRRTGCPSPLFLRVV